MKYGHILSALISLSFLGTTALAAQPLGVGKYNRQMEALQRGVIARDAVTKGVFISWRNLASEDVKYNVYKNGKKLNSAPLDASNYVDENGTENDTYFITSVTSDGTESERSEGVKPFKEYLSIPLDKPQPAENKIYELAEYSASKAGVGDLDGDGEYEIVVVWYPDNAKDNSQEGHTSPVYIDAYEISGKKLWRINMGPNIRAGEHYVPMAVYDLDGDGKAEVALRTSDGTVAGDGKVIGDKNKNWADSRGYILSGPEYITVFDGETGKKLSSIPYSPERGNVADWGDTGGNRVDRFLCGIAYLDGKTPSLITSRGYYTDRSGAVGKTGITAYSFKDGKIEVQWEFKACIQEGLNADYVGQGNHSMVTADVDDDGFDEIIYGSMVVDHNGEGLYSTKRGHGDAIHVGFFKNEDRLQIVKANETVDVVTAGYGFEYRYADNGEMIFSVPGVKDNGRTIVAEVTPDAAGPIIYGAGGTGMWLNTKDNEWEQMNANGATIAFQIWWTGDLCRELGEGIYRNADGKTTYPGYKVVKYNNVTNNFDQMFNISGVISGRRPLFQGDIIGDWREELLLADEDGSRMRLYTTNIPTEYNLTTLMHDPKYRLGIATEPSGYSQPPWTGYYIGNHDFEIPKKGDFIYNEIPAPKITDNYTIEESVDSVGNVIVLKIDKSNSVINGNLEKIDENEKVVPYIENERTLVPIRFLSEKLGYTVGYNEETKKIVLENGDKKVEMQLGSDVYTVNGTEYKFDVKIQVKNDRTFVPLRALGELIGMNVEWDDGFVLISDTKDINYDEYKNMF